MLPLPLSLLLLVLLFLLLLPEIVRCSSGVGMRWGRWLGWGFVRLVIFGILRGRMLLFDFVYLFPWFISGHVYVYNVFYCMVCVLCI